MDTFTHLLTALRRLSRLDAAAVLLLEPGGALRVVAQIGLLPHVDQLAFHPDEHRRLLQGMRTRGPLRFRDSAEPDPYDGLLRDGNELSPIHACMVMPLMLHSEVAGLLTLDALRPDGLDALRDEDAALAAALGAAALQKQRLRDELRKPRPLLPATAGASSLALLGESAAMRSLRREVAVLGPLPLPVLITGESGTGKDLVARALHACSPRASRPLLAVNCGALTEGLLGAELFGHARGAFTSAARARQGKFAAADRGTLFLDEIGELSPQAQVALLRAVQEGEIQRVGEDRPQQVDVRLLLATHRELAVEVAKGQFRADLYHRLMLYPLRVPTLRERRDDLPLLVRHFAAAFCASLGREPLPAPQEVLERLATYDWPGNVRELKHAIERALLRQLVEQEGGRAHQPLPLRLQYLDLGQPASASPVPESLSALLERTRREALAASLHQSGGNVAEAARTLGISRSFAYKEALRLGLLSRRS